MSTERRPTHRARGRCPSRDPAAVLVGAARAVGEPLDLPRARWPSPPSCCFGFVDQHDHACRAGCGPLSALDPAQQQRRGRHAVQHGRGPDHVHRAHRRRVLLPRRAATASAATAASCSGSRCRSRTSRPCSPRRASRSWSCPLIAFALSVATQLVLLAARAPSSCWRAVSSAARAVDARCRSFQMPLIMLYGLAVHALWYAPLYGWLLLVSAWARRTPFLWAVLPPLALGRRREDRVPDLVFRHAAAVPRGGRHDGGLRPRGREDGQRSSACRSSTRWGSWPARASGSGCSSPPPSSPPPSGCAAIASRSDSGTARMTTEVNRMTTATTDAPTPRKPLRLWPGVARRGRCVAGPVRRARRRARTGCSYGAADRLRRRPSLVLVWWLFFSRAPWAERVGASS